MRNVNPDMIVLAREASGLSQVEVATRTGISQAKLSKIENGIFEPTPCEIERLGAALNVAPDFFNQTDRVYGLGSSMLFNRKRKAVPIGLQKKIQAQVNIARMQIDRLLRGAEIEQSKCFTRYDIDEYDGDTERVAGLVRTAWNVPVGPITDLTTLVEAAGGVVLKCDFGTEQIDAAHLWLPDLPPMFFVNSLAPADRYRWNLAHEIGHAVMHAHPMGDIEKQANEFAAAFLLPAEHVAHHLTGLTLEKAAQLKPYWRVSIQAIIWRAYLLGAIDRTRYHNLFKSLSARGYRRNEPIPLPPEHPRIVSQLIQLHRSALGYGDEDLRRLLMTSKPEYVDVPDKTLSLNPGPDHPLLFAQYLKHG